MFQCEPGCHKIAGKIREGCGTIQVISDVGGKRIKRLQEPGGGKTPWTSIRSLIIVLKSTSAANYRPSGALPMVYQLSSFLYRPTSASR